MIVDLDERRRTRAASARDAPKTITQCPSFRADFYDMGGQIVCHATNEARDLTTPTPAIWRRWADMMIKTAMDLIAKAEQGEPELGTPVAVVRLHANGVMVVSAGKALRAMPWPDIERQMARAAEVLAGQKDGV